MAYLVKEIFYTLQGEGANVGRPAVFCRFSGCNLWSGKEQDRDQALCRFCDTDFVGTDGPNGGKYDDPAHLAHIAADLFPEPRSAHVHPLVVCTGGEPLLQLDALLVAAFHAVGFDVALETNGTLLPPADIDWISVSPKDRTELKLRTGNELKLVFPQDKMGPDLFEHLDFDHFFLQPMDGSHIDRNTQLALDYCLKHPQWRLSLQTHKLLDIP